MSITGARGASVKQVAISLLNVGIVLKSDLTDPDAPVNTVSMSGKAMGGLVVAVDADGFSNPRIYMATSSASDAEWIDLADSGADVVIPDATTTVKGVVLQGAAVANANATSSSVVAALATGADLPTTVAKVNEVITALNAVRSDSGSALTTVNAALTSLRASGALAT